MCWLEKIVYKKLAFNQQIFKQKHQAIYLVQKCFGITQYGDLDYLRTTPFAQALEEGVAVFTVPPVGVLPTELPWQTTIP